MSKERDTRRRVVGLDTLNSSFLAPLSVFSAFRRLLRISSLAGSTEAPSVKKRSRSSFEHDSDDSVSEDEELAEAT